MRWLLLLVVMGTSVGISAQSTLKIYVTDNDDRSDMVIIDLNTSTIANYGKSVDSTNVQFYTVTMSTQVIRMSYEELFGPDETEPMPLAELVDKENQKVKSIEILSLNEPVASAEQITEIFTPTSIRENHLTKPVTTTQQTYSGSRKSTQTVSLDKNYRTTSPFSKRRKPSKQTKAKKIKRSGKYKGQCPKFF